MAPVHRHIYFCGWATALEQCKVIGVLGDTAQEHRQLPVGGGTRTHTVKVHSALAEPHSRRREEENPMPDAAVTTADPVGGIGLLPLRGRRLRCPTRPGRRWCACTFCTTTSYFFMCFVFFPMALSKSNDRGSLPSQVAWTATSPVVVMSLVRPLERLDGIALYNVEIEIDAITRSTG